MNTADFPEKLKFLFQPAPYKVARGGRGGLKSWSFARALLLLGINKPLRILCAREVQESIAASVHQLLKDQIKLLGIGAKYKILDQQIRGDNGTLFIFSGLSTHTVETIKSYENIDICWVEEGQVISERSWEILDPTIRKAGSEIWVSFNPSLDTDPTFKRFVTNPPPGTISVEINWRDAPVGWVTPEMKAKRLHDKSTLSKAIYENKWEGKCLPAVEGAIFFDEIQEMEREQRIRNVPYDPQLKVHMVTDLGYRHACGIALVQVMTSEIRVIWYREFFQEKLSWVSSEIRELRYNWGKAWLPFADGFSKSSKGQDSADQILAKSGWNVAKKKEVAQLDVEASIRTTREKFPRMYWDRLNAGLLLENGRRYQRTVGVKGNMGAPLQNEYTDAGDVIRYIATNADKMTNDSARPRIPIHAPVYASHVV